MERKNINHQGASKMTTSYTEPDYVRFVADMIAAGLEVRHYHGRNFYQGPAVVVRVVKRASRHTTVDCQWDRLGNEMVVYPATKGGA